MIIFYCGVESSWAKHMGERHCKERDQEETYQGLSEVVGQTMTLAGESRHSPTESNESVGVQRAVGYEMGQNKCLDIM